jgi:PIN domain nuclease of toxin-antitoxin system
MEQARVSTEAMAAVAEAYERGDYLYVSPYTALEIGMLTSRGRLPLSISPVQWFRRLLAVPLIRLTDLSPDILIASSFLPDDTLRDPADKVIIAMGRELGMTIITRDRLILDYAARGHVSALAC